MDLAVEFNCNWNLMKEFLKFSLAPNHAKVWLLQPIMLHSQKQSTFFPTHAKPKFLTIIATLKWYLSSGNSKPWPALPGSPDNYLSILWSGNRHWKSTAQNDLSLLSDDVLIKGNMVLCSIFQSEFSSSSYFSKSTTSVDFLTREKLNSDLGTGHRIITLRMFGF